MNTPGETPYEVDGTVIGYLEQIDPDGSIGKLPLLAIWHLTEAPLEIRQRFLAEFTGYVSLFSHVDEGVARDVVRDRIGYFCAGQGSIEDGKRFSAAWKEADEGVSNILDLEGKRGIWKDGKIAVELPGMTPDHFNPN